MSIWSTTHVIRAKKYRGSHVDPRRKDDAEEIELAMVADYVYRDSGQGDRVLPYIRLSVGDADVLLTERAALELASALEGFIARPKWRGR